MLHSPGVTTHAHLTAHTPLSPFTLSLHTHPLLFYKNKINDTYSESIIQSQFPNNKKNLQHFSSQLLIISVNRNKDNYNLWVLTK